MVRLTTDCSLIDPTGYETEDLLLLLKTLVEKNLDKVNVLVKPASIVSRSRGGFTKLLAVPPGALAICVDTGGFPNVFGNSVYSLEKDVWVDTGVLNLKVFLPVLNSVLNAVSTKTSTALDTGRFIFETRYIHRVYSKIIVMDSFKIPLYWLGDRLDPLNEDYRELFKQVVQGSPNGLHILSFAKLHNDGFEILAGFKHVGNKILFIINTPESSKVFLKYVAWLLIDIFIE